MSTIPKLALIPSGVKASKVYSVLPTDGTGDFTFARAGAATRVNSEGLIEEVLTNVPRLNYPMIDGVVSGCPNLLLEPQRTNLITYSEDFDNAYWTKSGSSVVGGFISPKGDLSAFKLVESSSGYGSIDHNIYSTSISILNSTEYTVHHYIKSGENNIVGLQDVINSQYWATINLITGVVLDEKTSGNTKVTLMSNNFYKISIKFTSNTVNARPAIFLLPNTYQSGRPSDMDYVGDGTSGIYIFGAQLEQGSYPTSYIKSNSGSITTRVAETANGAGDANTFNDSEGVLFAEISAFQEILTTNEHIVLRNSASTDFSNSILIQHRNDGNLRIYADGFATGNIQFIVTDMNWLENNKIAIQYDSIGSNWKLFLNGISQARYSSAINQSVVGLNDISYYWGSSSNPFYGNTKQIQYFDSALNDTDLETLTSWTSFSEMATGQLYSVE